MGIRFQKCTLLINVCNQLPKLSTFFRERIKIFRNVSKYLNSLPEESTKFGQLITYIDEQCALLKTDTHNVFVYIKNIFEKIKYTIRPKTSDQVQEPLPTENNHSDQPAEGGDKSESISPNREEAASTSSATIISRGPLSHTDKTLKEVLQEFLSKCQKNLSPKMFNLKFKEIIGLMNTLDPAHLNSLPLKQFVCSKDHDIGACSDRETMTRVDSIASEIRKYQKNKNKRELDESMDKAEHSAEKRLCLEKDMRSENNNLSAGPEVEPSSTNCQMDHDNPIEKENSMSEIADKVEHSEVGEMNSDVKKRVTLTVVEKSSSAANSTTNVDTKTEAAKAEQAAVEKNSDIMKKRVALTPVQKSSSPESPSSNANGDNVNEAENHRIIEPEKEKEVSFPTEMEGSQKVEKSKKKELNGEKKIASSKHIKKLELALKKCAKEIKRLEEAEVDWDDENEESNYVLCAKYKRRYMQLHKKIAEYKKMSSSLDRKCDKKFVCTESRYPEINKKIQKFVNKTKQFPDFHDIRALVLDANKELHLSSVQVHEEAQDIFRSVGKRLKGRREIDESNILMSYLPEDQTAAEDPASKDEELNKLLIEQGKLGKKNLEKYFDDFYAKHVLKNDSSAAEPSPSNDKHLEDKEKDTLPVKQDEEVSEEKIDENVNNPKIDKEVSPVSAAPPLPDVNIGDFQSGDKCDTESANNDGK